MAVWSNWSSKPAWVSPRVSASKQILKRELTVWLSRTAWVRPWALSPTVTTESQEECCSIEGEMRVQGAGIRQGQNASKKMSQKTVCVSHKGLHKPAHCPWSWGRGAQGQLGVINFCHFVDHLLKWPSARVTILEKKGHFNRGQKLKQV